MTSIESIHVFVVAVRKGSLTVASRSLRMSNSTISRRISALEKELEVQLVDRTSRRFKLTEAGAAFLPRAEAALEAVAQAEEAARSTRKAPEGRLRVHCRTQLGLQVIGPLLPTFAQAYPDIRLEVDLSERSVNLVEHDYDIDIRTGPSEDSSFAIKRLQTLEAVLVCSPAFAKAHPRIQHPRDLQQLPCLVYRREQEAATWKYKEDRQILPLQVPAALSSNSGELLRVAAMGGMGIALLAKSSVQSYLQEGSLTRLLPQYRFAVMEFDAGVYAVFRNTKTLPQKVRAFVDYLQKALRA
jgi:DNA-binding transcriptional LysR family regulator